MPQMLRFWTLLILEAIHCEVVKKALPTQRRKPQKSCSMQEAMTGLSCVCVCVFVLCSSSGGLFKYFATVLTFSVTTYTTELLSHATIKRQRLNIQWHSDLLSSYSNTTPLATHSRCCQAMHTKHYIKVNQKNFLIKSTAVLLFAVARPHSTHSKRK